MASLLDNVPRLETLAGRMQEVSTLPEIAMRVMDVVNDPRTSAADLKEVVESDPSLTVRMLRTVNSAAYSFRTQVSSIQRAISIMGFREVRNLAITASVAEMFKEKTPTGTYSRQALWQHLIAVGFAGRYLAGQVAYDNPDEVYMAGLLHDFGVILLDQHAHKFFMPVVASADPARPLSDVESDLLGFDHAQLGYAVARHWSLPLSVQLAIKYHHNSCDYTGPERPILQLVEIANFLCFHKKYRAIEGFGPKLPKTQTFSDRGIDKQQLKIIYRDVDAELAKARAYVDA